jgi:hypothetical protein
VPGDIGDHFEAQAKDSDNLGSPFTGMLCRLLGERLDPGASRFARRIVDWPGDLTTDRVPLRASGALHAVARSGRNPALKAAYPPNPTTREALWSAVASTLSSEDGFLTAYLDSAPQTNEVARSSAILGGALVLARETGLPLEMNEFGASAGLNLGFDGYTYDLGDAGTWGSPSSPVKIASRWEGAPPPLGQTLTVSAHAGSDLRPLDPRSADDRGRLMSYIWPDQQVRLTRTEAALAMAAAAPWRVVEADAADWVRDRLSRPPTPGVVRVISHTIVWLYLPAATRASIERSIREAGAAATRTAPVAWLMMENDDVPGSAGLRLTIWPGGETRYLGRVDFHGRWVRWENRLT